MGGLKKYPPTKLLEQLPLLEHQMIHSCSELITTTHESICCFLIWILSFNSFLASVLILYPLKTSENLGFSGVFRGNEMGTLARNGLMWIFSSRFLNHNVPLTQCSISIPPEYVTENLWFSDIFRGHRNGTLV